MSDQKGKSKKLSGYDAPTNGWRGDCVQIDAGHRIQNTFAQPQGMQKEQTQSRLDTNMPFEINLVLDPMGKSGAPQIVVIPDDPSAESKADIPSDAMPWVNDLSSHRVEGQSPDQVLQRLTAVLQRYSAELDLSVDAEHGHIDAVLFTPSSFEALRFKLAVFEHDGATRFELLRHDGSALDGQIGGRFENAFFFADDAAAEQKEEVAASSFIAFDLDVSGMAPPPNTMVADLGPNLKGVFFSDLDEIHESLARNGRHCVDDLADLYSDLCADGTIAAAIADHGKLVGAMLGFDGGDIAVLRASLLILDEMCSDRDTAMVLMEEHALYKRLGELLAAEGQPLLVRNYALRLVAKLSALPWNMDSSLAKEVLSAVRRHHGEWEKSLTAQSGLVAEETFTSITAKLSRYE